MQHWTTGRSTSALEAEAGNFHTTYHPRGLSSNLITYIGLPLSRSVTARGAVPVHRVICYRSSRSIRWWSSEAWTVGW